MSKRKRRRRPHIPADLSTCDGRQRARKELVWSDHGFLRVGFSNLHKISDEMWRSNQPSPEQITRHAAERGIRTIVNLRGESLRGHYLLEREACAAAGVRLVDFQVFSRDTPTPESVLASKELFSRITYPALMHCKSGADRAGLMSVLYLIGRKGEPVDRALSQLSLKYLHVRQGKTGLLDAFFAAALSAGANTPDVFFRWVENEYDRVAVKADFLRARGRQIELDRLLGRE
ncbi:MAG: sulfur transferase domain-containing protein [Pseudomonadota bacterium]